MIFSGQMEKGSKGFTFFEVLVVVVLLVVGFVSLIQIFSIGLFADVQVENNTTAMYLAQEKMEEVRNANTYADIDSYASARAALTGDFAGFEREVTVSLDPKQVNVIVYWDANGSEQNINLVSLFADYNY